MREIKFRVFDELSGGKSNAVMRYFNLWESSSICSLGENVDLMPLMQYTGLLDKNGKEIYEGDIISTGGVHIGDVIGIIMYESPRYMYQAVGGKVDGIMFEIVGHKKFEIIGNIYENPELLDN